MFRKKEDPDIVGKRTAVRCFIGSAMGSTAFMIAYFARNEMIALIMGIFLAWAILMFFDAILPYDRRFHAISGLVAFIAGIIISVIMSPLMHFFLVITIILGILVYIKHVKVIISPFRRRVEDEE